MVPTTTPGIVVTASDEPWARSHKSSTGFKLTAAKSLDEYAKLDAEDESLARWKASLGIVPGAVTTCSGPKVSIICGPEFYRGLPSTVTR